MIDAQRPRRFRHRTLTAALAVGLVLVPAAAASSVTAAAGPAPFTRAPAASSGTAAAGAVSFTRPPAVGNPTAEGVALLDRFFGLLVARNIRALGQLLSPAFQVVRANGGVQDKASYLARLPDVRTFTIRRAAGRASDGVLTVSYLLTVREIIDGKVQPVGPAPRLSVFAWQHGSWRLVAHANFGAIKRAGRPRPAHRR